MDDFFFDEKSVKAGRCDGCEHCKTVTATGQWEFFGCYCKPYRGKWVAEIKECPLKGEDEC